MVLNGSSKASTAVLKHVQPGDKTFAVANPEWISCSPNVRLFEGRNVLEQELV